MFGEQKEPKAAEEAAILLDGPRASFAFLRTDDVRLTETVEPLSWTWSACVRHMVTVLRGSDLVCLRRWDEPDASRRFQVPQQGMGALSLLAHMESAAGPKRPNVVQHVIEPFRQIRMRLGTEEALWAVRFLNGLLLATEVARRKPECRTDIGNVRTFEDAFRMLTHRDRKLCGLTDPPRRAVGLEASDLVRRMLAADPYTGCQLHPALLLRHAASKLYQEAHLEIEKNPQGYFPGLEPTHEPAGAGGPRDVRFTPPNLARVLVQKALQSFSGRRDRLTILDPACGSGVFLVEAIRELSTRSSVYSGTIRTVGYDTSDISEYTTRFCLEHAKREPGLSRAVQIEVVKCDSLDRSWADADIILMNPPFIPWERLSSP